MEMTANYYPKGKPKNKTSNSKSFCNDGLEGLASMKERIEKAHKEQERIIYNMPGGDDKDVALRLMKDYFFRDMLKIWKAL